MRKWGQLGASIAIVAAITGLLPGAPAVAGSTQGKERQEAVLPTTGGRYSHGRSDVAMNRRISKLVHRHSVWMASTGKFEHTQNPSSSYLQGVPWRCWGENIAVSGGTMRDVEKAFMASSEHTANILN